VLSSCLPPFGRGGGRGCGAMLTAMFPRMSDLGKAGKGFKGALPKGEWTFAGQKGEKGGGEGSGTMGKKISPMKKYEHS